MCAPILMALQCGGGRFSLACKTLQILIRFVLFYNLFFFMNTLKLINLWKSLDRSLHFLFCHSEPDG